MEYNRAKTETAEQRAQAAQSLPLVPCVAFRDRGRAARKPPLSCADSAGTVTQRVGVSCLRGALARGTHGLANAPPQPTGGGPSLSRHADGETEAGEGAHASETPSVTF